MPGRSSRFRDVLRDELSVLPLVDFRRADHTAVVLDIERPNGAYQATWDLTGRAKAQRADHAGRPGV